MIIGSPLLTLRDVATHSIRNYPKFMLLSLAPDLTGYTGVQPSISAREAMFATADQLSF
jgi:hypothetical protein